jgi:hypothetical protein
MPAASLSTGNPSLLLPPALLSFMLSAPLTLPCCFYIVLQGGAVIYACLIPERWCGLVWRPAQGVCRDLRLPHP